MKTFSVFDIEAAAKLFAPLLTEHTDLIQAIRDTEQALGAEVYINVLDNGQFRADAWKDSSGVTSDEDSPSAVAALVSLYSKYSNVTVPESLIAMMQEAA